MNNKVSVIIPVYNVEDYLCACLNSIIGQTYSNIEIILIDDGSTDKSGQICDEYGKIDCRVRVIHQSNQGVTFARKQGVELSKGDWILFVDGDDEIVDTCVESFLQIAITYNVQMVISPEIKRSPKGVFQSRFYCSGLLTKEDFMKNMSMQMFNGGIGGKFWNKDLYYVGVLDASSKIKNNEDYLMNLRLAKKMNSAYVEAYKGLYVVNYRQCSASHTRLSKENWFALYDVLLSYAIDIGYYPLLFLLGSLEQRLKNKEIDATDVRRYADRIILPSNVKLYYRLMHVWMKSGKLFYKILFKILRYFYRKNTMNKIYGNY